MTIKAENFEVADEVISPVTINVVYTENWATVAFVDLRPSTLGALVSSVLVQDHLVRVVEVIAD